MSDFSTKMRDGTATRLITKYGITVTFRRNYSKVPNAAAGTTVSTIYKSGVTIAAVSDGFTDSANEFVSKGFAVGQYINVSGFTSAGINTGYTIATVNANKITTTVAPSTTEIAGDIVAIEAKYISYTCKGIQQAYKDKDIDGTIIRTGDMQLLLTATYTDSLGVKQTLPVNPIPKDILIIQNAVWQIVNNEILAPAGIPIIHTLQIRT